MCTRNLLLGINRFRLGGQAVHCAPEFSHAAQPVRAMPRFQCNPALRPKPIDSGYPSGGV